MNLGNEGSIGISITRDLVESGGMCVCEMIYCIVKNEMIYCIVKNEMIYCIVKNEMIYCTNKE